MFRFTVAPFLQGVMKNEKKKKGIGENVLI